MVEVNGTKKKNRKKYIVEVNGTSGHEDGELAATFKCVRQGEEWEEDVLM